MKLISLIKWGALAFTGTALYYLGSNGEIGVNMQTVLATAPSGFLVIFSGLFELVKYVLPATVVKLFVGKLTPIIGAENVAYLQQLAREKSPKEIVNSIGELVNEFQSLKKDISLIKERQENVM